MRPYLGRPASSEATSGWASDNKRDAAQAPAAPSAPSAPSKRRRSACQLALQALLVASVTLNAAWGIKRIFPERQEAPGAASGEGEGGWEGGQEASLGAQRRFAWESFVVREEEQAGGGRGGNATFGPVTDRRHKPKASLLDGKCAPWVPQLREHLKDIVLIVNINYDFVSLRTHAFLRTVYGRFFFDIVFVGPNDIPSIPVEARGSPYWRQDWCYAYLYLPNVVARYPSAEGFLWTNDDVVLNYWHLLEANKSKLWIPDTPDCQLCQGWGRLNLSHPSQMPDGWSDQPWRKKPAIQAYERLQGRYAEQYNASIAPKRMVYSKRVVDIFYIPRRLCEPLLFDLLPIFRQFGVCSELAIPMMFFALEHPSQYEPLFRRVMYNWNRGPEYDPRLFWKRSLVAYHHWKLATDSSKIALLKALSEVDPCLLPLFISMTTGRGS